MPKYLSQVEMTFFIESELPDGYELTDTEEGRKLLIEGAMKCLQHLLQAASPEEQFLHCLEQFVVCQHGEILPHEIDRIPGCTYLRQTPESTDA